MAEAGLARVLGTHVQHPSQRTPLHRPQTAINKVQQIFVIYTAEFLYFTGKDLWKEPNFSTECFFFALRAHSLSIVANMRKHGRRKRATRELDSMIRVKAKLASDGANINSVALWCRSH